MRKKIIVIVKSEYFVKEFLVCIVDFVVDLIKFIVL